VEWYGVLKVDTEEAPDGGAMSSIISLAREPSPRIPRLPRPPRAEMIDEDALASCRDIEWGDRLRAADRRIEARDWATIMHR
jgi:hypothetical protein